MAKKREPIDDLIDAHVWMRRKESRLNRPLMLDNVPDELLAESGLRRGGATARRLVFRLSWCSGSLTRATAVLLDGLHRWRMSLALGFVAIPATQPRREAAELGYGYVRPNDQC
jgi:hypothetical protein